MLEAAPQPAPAPDPLIENLIDFDMDSLGDVQPWPKDKPSA